MLDKIRNLGATTHAAAVAAFFVFINPWLALLSAMVAASHEVRKREAWDVPSWLLWFPCIASILWWFVLHPMPFDDLNRHVLAWRLGYDYRSQYPLAEMPATDMWLGFDWFMYQLQRVFSLTPVQVARWWPLLMFVSSYGLFMAACRKAGAQHSRSFLLLVITVMVVPLSTRAWMGRPEFLYVLMLGWAMFCQKAWQRSLWIVVFAALIPSYWMGWPYAAGVLLFPWEAQTRKAWVARITIGAGLAVAHVGFWQWYTGDYLYIMDWLKRTLATVLPTESFSLDQTLLQPAGLVLFLWAGYALTHFNKETAKEHLPALLVLGWLSFSNQVRFLAPLVLVGVPWLLSVTKPVEATAQVRLFMVFAALVLGCKGVGDTYPKQPKFAVPTGSFVVSTDPFAAVLYGAPGVRVEPSPAIGATPIEKSKGLSQQGFDCDRAKAAGVTHLIEHTLPKKPSCATLIEVQDIWRFWRIE